MNFISALPRGSRNLRSMFAIFLAGTSLVACGGSSGGMQISGLIPDFGGPSSLVDLEGRGFPTDAAVTVKFNDTKLEVGSTNYSHITAFMPAKMRDTTSSIEVISSSGEATSTEKFSLYNFLYSVAHDSNGEFVAVGDDGTLLTSSDGIDWVLQPWFTQQAFSHVGFSGDLALLVGPSGLIYTSTDEKTWTLRNSGTTESLSSVASSGGAIVAVGADGTIIVSPDGTAWSRATSPTTQWLSSVTWTGTQFVACGADGAILTSADGSSWTLMSTIPTDNAQLHTIAFGSSTFLVGDSRGTIYRSADGINWTPETLPNPVGTQDITWSGTLFVAVGFAGVLTSPDGVTWTGQDLGLLDGPPVLSGVTFHDGTFVTVGETGTILTSIDGKHWTVRRGG